MLKAFLPNNLLLLLLLILAGCSTQRPPYVVPSVGGDYAILSKGSVGEGGKNYWQGEGYAFVHAIGGKSVKAFTEYLPHAMVEDLKNEGLIDPKGAILITPGRHDITVLGAEESWKNPLCGVETAEALLIFDAEPGGRYMLHGEMSKKYGYAIFWLVELKTNSVVAQPQKIRDLDCGTWLYKYM